MSCVSNNVEIVGSVPDWFKLTTKLKNILSVLGGKSPNIKSRIYCDLLILNLFKCSNPDVSPQ